VLPPFASIVVPALNDSDALAGLIATLPPATDFEVIVVNGGVWDLPLKRLIAARPDIRWLAAPPGRGRQMNAGAREAGGRWIVFLHADTRLPPEWLEVLRRIDGDHTIAGGSFRFRLDAVTLWARAIEKGVGLRVRWLDLPYGDQALFVRREAFGAVDGFREWPLMEDVDFVRRLRRVGALHHSQAAIVTSARRWRSDGWVRRSVENVTLLLLFLAGVSPHRLARRYHRPASSPSGDRAAVAVMARAPSDERGKTRVMRALESGGGEGAGAGLRRALLLDTLDRVGQVRNADLFVLFTPERASEEFRTLTGGAVPLIAQRGDGLGQRMCHAFADLFAAGYSRVVIIGSDLPSLPAARLDEALAALAQPEERGPESGDRVVLGPAGDGGYYLVGLRATSSLHASPHPSPLVLFQGMPWGTPEVFTRTVAAARRAGLAVSLIPPSDDVDDVEGLRRLAREAGSMAWRTRAWAAAHLVSPQPNRGDR
jgi:rSAM/selenodomain-associated transferase 2/rSAM/selenodomain-associated transferase 1